MKLRTPALAVSALGAGALLALAAPLAASAHVTVTPNSTAAGSYAVLTFAYGHGCEGSPTTALTIDIPEGINSVMPGLNSNYTIEKIADGDRTSQVVYTAVTPIADGFRDTVDIQVQLPEDAAGETLAFPVLQSCETGETNWSDPDQSADAPAPIIEVTEATGDGHSHGTSTDEHAEGDEHAETEEAAATTSASSDDTIARVLGAGGLVVGAVGVILAITARRSRKDA